MNKTVILLLALATFASCGFLRSHDYWYTAQRAVVATGAPFADVAWNYCDFKCLYLEKYYPANDFVFMVFSQSAITPNFGACYVKANSASVGANGVSVSGYALWNTVASNPWYEANCGKETEDYYALTKDNGTTKAKYSLVGAIQGEGIGAEITY